MTWEYQIARIRECASCRGEGGLVHQGIFRSCILCDGTGEEREESTLEDALKDSALIKEMREDIWVMMNG